MPPEHLEAIFATRGWLSRQPEAFRSSFIAMGRLVTLARGEPVFHAGDDSGGVFGIVSGGITVFVGTRWQSPAAGHIERAGDWFGHGPVFSGGKRMLGFVATEPSCLLQVPLEKLRPPLRDDPDFAARIGHMAEASNEIATATTRDLLIRDSTRRLAAVLLRVTAMGEVPPGDPQGYFITQGELGDLANISRHQVNRIFAMLQRAGLIDVNYNRVRLLDIQRLKDFAYAEN